MAHPVKVNNFIQKSAPRLDVSSKIFIIFELLLGLNRFTLAINTLKLISFVLFLYSLTFIGLVCYLTAYGEQSYFNIAWKIFQYLVYTIAGFATQRKLQFFYNELNKFDLEVGFPSKTTQVSLKNIFQAICVIAFTIFTLYNINLKILIVLQLLHVVENQYYGHLFHLLIQRLRTINSNVKSTIGNDVAIAPTEVENDNRSRIEMNKLMNLYYIIVNAYEMLTGAIEKQLLLVIISSFVCSMEVSYYVAEAFLFHNVSILTTLRDLCLVVVEVMPLMAPCMRCDELRAQVLTLRELLVDRLYGGKLDKASRSAARSLLALTKARSLSFSLLRMVDISISLPFSFLGLGATYLIILLQFEKVIYPNQN